MMNLDSPVQEVVRPLQLDERMIALAGAISIDFDYFSQHSHGPGESKTCEKASSLDLPDFAQEGGWGLDILLETLSIKQVCIWRSQVLATPGIKWLSIACLDPSSHVSGG